jgi:hypothetical protein
VISLRSRSYLTDRPFAQDVKGIIHAKMTFFLRSYLCLLYLTGDVSLKVNWIRAEFLCISYSRNRSWRPIGLLDVKDPTLFRQSTHIWRQGCQLYPPAALYTPETLFFCFWYSFLLEAEQALGPSAAGRIR